MDEMMEDAMGVLDDEDIEDAVDSEVDKVLFELTAGQLGQMPEAGSAKLPQAQVEEEVELPDDEDDLADRLAGLRSWKIIPSRMYIFHLSFSSSNNM